MTSGWISESDIPQIWKDKLEPAVICLLRGEPLPEAYTVLYTTIYNVCTTGPRVDRHLYTEVVAFFATYTAQIHGAAPDDDAAVPYYYDTQWDTFSRGVVVVDRLFAYLNRDYVKRETDVGKDVKTIREVALDQWKTNVFEPMAPRLEEVLGTDLPRIAAIRAKFSFENVTAEDFAAMRVRETPAASA
ncbi:Cullin repeat-like-containing domain protein [Mycena polygramma]|nr:Cullin repeat-like-containing domain protein [Mycena polygramma]